MSQPHVETAGLHAPAAKEPLFTRDFLLASVMTLATFSSFYLLMATLPVYIMQEPIRGSESEVGLIIGVFSGAAIILRPFVGKWADDHGKHLFIVGGSVVFALTSGLYALVVTVPVLLALRLVHGAGWASTGTATNALIADLAPRSRRGEAMGYYGMFSNLAMAFGPALGVILMVGYGFPALFATSAALSVVALLISLAIREPARSGPPQPAGGAGQGIIERTAVFPALILTMTTVTYGAIVSFLPLFATKQGMENPGVFFTAYAITVLAARSLTGQLSDRYGRAAVIAPGLCLATAALWLLAFASSLPAFIGAAVLYGLGFAAIQPALMAFVVDRAPANRRGAAMGTFSTAMDLGIGCGSVMWGFVVQATDFRTMYAASGVVTLLTLAVFLTGVRSRSAEGPSGA